MFEHLIRQGFQFGYHSHAQAILAGDFPDAADELARALAELSLPIEEIIAGGGGETKLTQRLRRSLSEAGWRKARFEVEKIINGTRTQSQSHEIDHVRRLDAGTIALEIEWNNKDPFFDRDLENFKRLHADGAISLGVIITRGTSLQAGMADAVRRFLAAHAIASFEALQVFGLSPTPRQRQTVEAQTGRAQHPRDFADAFADHFVADKFGTATTHWAKLEDRIRRGVGNPCPLLLIGLPSSILRFS
ncbi:MAG: restriction endonuclease [Rhodospirillales bacterium]|nr:restriction endonuclease [Rhodospirillales bacterium]